MKIIDRIERIIEPTVNNLGFDIVRVLLSGDHNPRLQIMAEPLDGRAMSVDDCAAISRAVSALLDVEDPVSSAYTLEVSSPGLDRPFKTTRDYQRALGKRVKVLFVGENGGTVSLIGMLEGIKNGTVEIISGEEKHCIPFECIKKAHRELDQDWDKG